MRLARTIGSVRERVQRDGLGALLHDAQVRALDRLGQFQIMRGMTVRVPDVRDPSLFDAHGYQARFLEPDELEQLSRDDAHQMPPAFLRVALARGDRCYALFDRAALAAYGWYAARPTPLDEHFTLHFDPAWTYMYKGYTLPAWRGKRLHAVGMCRALRALSEEGQRGLISCVASNNFASLHSVVRMGYRIFGSAWLLRAFGLSLSCATPGCRDYGFRVVPEAPTPASRRGSASTTRLRGG